MSISVTAQGAARSLAADTLPWLAMLLALAGCASMHESEDYQRHRDSQLVMPLNGGEIFYFDARVTPQLPADDAAAEARRIAWLESWLALRKLCGAGYEILARRPFRFEESNPGRFDLRYELRCRSQPAEQTSADGLQPTAP